VDARDRLRRYLEQRRDLGESEFVLDGLSVDEVLKVVGAAGPRRRGGAGERSTGERSTGERSTGAMSPPHPETEVAPPAPELPPPPIPARRFAAGATTDWREALRGAGAPVPPHAPVADGPVSGSPPPAAAGADSKAPLPPWLAALDVPAGLAAGRVRVADMAPEVAALPTLDDVAAHVTRCTACSLHNSARHPVPGEGHPRAELLCVGEAPGANEDDQGRPFVGDAGQLLTKILGAIQLTREEVFICNVLKHRPPGNRDPLPDEVTACQPYLLRQIELVQPRVILALGRFAAQSLLQTTAAIGALRGKLHQYQGVPLIVTYHPAALLRNEAWKRPTWDDVKLARRVLDAARAHHAVE
jgi:DNA polymerase